MTTDAPLSVRSALRAPNSWPHLVLALVFASGSAACDGGADSSRDDDTDTAESADGGAFADGGGADVDAETSDTADGDASDVEPGGATLTVMTFNVLCSFCDPENYDPWADRLGYFADIFARYEPDVIGLQELVLPADVDALVDAAGAGEFDALYFDRPPDLPYPDSTLLLRSARFEVIDWGVYWLSPTPDEPMSTGFAERQLPRNVTWAVVRDRSDDEELFVSTTHFDNNVPSQDLSALLWRERTHELAAGRPVIATGDFNSQPTDAAYATLIGDAPVPELSLVDTWDVALAHDQPGLGDDAPPFSGDDRIDHIIVSSGVFDVASWSLDRTRYGPNDRFPSDHPAVASTLRRRPDSHE